MDSPSSDIAKSAVRSNKIRFLVILCFQTVVALCANGALMQSFLLTVGFSERMVYLHSTAWQIANVATILLASRVADRGHLLRRAALVSLLQIPPFLLYLPLCFRADGGSGRMFAYLVGVALVHSVILGVECVFEYKVPYYVFRPEEYGTIMSLGGVFSYGITFGLGILMTRLSARYAYADMMKWAFVGCAAALALVAFIRLFQKPLIPLPLVGNGLPDVPKIPLGDVFRHPTFFWFLPAHFLRGVAFGTTTVLSVICLSRGFSVSVVTSMVSVQSAAMLIGSAVVALMLKFFSPRVSVFAGSLLFLLFPLLLRNDEKIFLGACFLILFGRILVDNAVPSLILLAVPVEIAGPYNAIRMAIHFGGALTATTVAALVPTKVLISLTIGCQLAAAGFYIWAPVRRNTTRSAPGRNLSEPNE